MLKVMSHIHFICRGNVYRSRLAEAYAKSLLPQHTNLVITSSGIQANLNLDGDVEAAALAALEAENIQNYLAPTWRQTTQKILDEADLLVFMNDTVYQDACHAFQVQPDKCIVWHIKDIDGIYPLVKVEVDKLMNSYEKTPFYDEAISVDEHRSRNRN